MAKGRFKMSIESNPKYVISNGFYVLAETGECISDIVIDYGYNQLFHDFRENSYYHDKYNHDHCSGTKLGFSFNNNPKYRKLARLQKTYFSSNAEKTLLKAVNIFLFLKSVFKVKIHLDFFKFHFQKIYPEMQPHTFQRNLEFFCSILFYTICKQNSWPISIKNMLTWSEINYKKYQDILSSILKINPELSIPVKISKIEHIFSSLNVFFSIYSVPTKIILKIIPILRQDFSKFGNNPRRIIGIAVLLGKMVQVGFNFLTRNAFTKIGQDLKISPHFLRNYFYSFCFERILSPKNSSFFLENLAYYYFENCSYQRKFHTPP